MIRTTLIIAAIVGNFPAGVAVADELTTFAHCSLNQSIPTLAVSRLARIHAKSRNVSPRLAQVGSKLTGSFPWWSVPRVAAFPAVCTRCDL